MSILVRVDSATHSFGRVEALRGVSFELRAGEVHALVGENGAGKSTLIRIVTGALRPDKGSLEIGGERVDSNDPLRSKSLGVAAIYQQPALFPELTVMENIALGLERPGAWRRVSWRERRRQVTELLARVGARIDPAAEVRSLSMPEQQLVEIARAVGARARVLILDEPTASLSPEEVGRLFAVLRDRRAAGVGMIYVSHRLDELFEIADRVTVLRDGSVVGTRRISEVDRAELIRMMVGRELDSAPRARKQPGEVFLEARDLTCRASGLQSVSLSVRAGEILGIAGLVGAGRTELARTLFGLAPADGGQILVGGRPVDIPSPARARELGIAYVPEDRRRHGVILDLSVAENTTLAVLDGLFLDERGEHALASEFVERLDIRTTSIHAPVSTLSGGNQQKVALARWMAARPRAIILDEPTQGIDIGAKAEIHRRISDLASSGIAVIVISSELPELLALSDCIAVMRRGSMVGILARAEATEERILSLAFGHGEAA